MNKADRESIPGEAAWPGDLLSRIRRPWDMAPVHRRLEQVGDRDMRVLYIGAFDTRGGAAIASSRLIAKMDGMDDVATLETVGRQQSHNPWTISLERAHRFIAWRETRKAFALRNMLASDPYGAMPFEVAWLRRVLALWQPDIIHMHNLHGGWGVLPNSFLPELARHAPIVWTLHDMWAATGHCAYAGTCEGWRTGCAACPDLASYPPMRTDKAGQHVAQKQPLLAEADPVLVAPSRWLANVMHEAAATRGRDIRVIANGLDLSIFNPSARAAGREKLRLDADEPAIMFAAETLNADTRKGAAELRSAIVRMQTRRADAPVSIILMGGGGEDLLNGISGLNVLRTGFVDGAADAAALYAAADLFVCPSLQDNLPNTLLEASACGTPSLVFDAAGSPETVENDVTGRIVRAGDAQAMGDAMADLIGDPASLSRMGAAARTRAEKLYGDDRMAADYRALYEELIASRETA